MLERQPTPWQSQVCRGRERGGRRIDRGEVSLPDLPEFTAGVPLILSPKPTPRQVAAGDRKSQARFDVDP